MKYLRENTGLINKIEEKELLCNSSFSTIYRVKIDGQSYILKETSGVQWPLSKIISSYEICTKLSYTERVVKIYDYGIVENKALLLMEDLSEYQNLIKIIVPSLQFKDNIVDQILDLFNHMWDMGFINYDFTIINLMVKDEKIKMIDVEYLENTNNMNLFRVLWFCERLDVIKNWYGKSYDVFMKIKESVLLKWSSTKPS
jgi:RIO-like serine/threonine protein kinase